MSQNTIGFLAAAVGTGVMAKAAELPTSFAGVAAAAVFAVCIGVSSFLKVEVPKPQPKAKKLSKKEKRARAAAANAPAEAAADEAAEAAAKVKADKKRVKEQARKKAKRAAAEQEKVAATQKKEETVEVAEVVAPAAVPEKKLTSAQAKKKKQKEKAKAKKAAAAAASGNSAEQKEAPVSAAEPATAAKEEPTDWEEVKVKKGKKKAELVTDSTAPKFLLKHFVQPKYFGLIIGPQGSNLKNLTEATGTEIEIPKEGGINYEILIEGSEAGCLRAKAAIEQLVKKGFCDITHAGTTDTSVPVPEKKRGIVIGNKGANIKILQEKLGVRINMPERGSDETDVTIVGDAEAVKKAAAAIKSLVEQGFSSLTHENFISTNLEVARDMLKILIGPKGATIRGLQDSTGVQINIPSDATGEMVVVSLTGEADAINDARVQILALMVLPEATPIPPEWSQQASLQHLDQW